MKSKRAERKLSSGFDITTGYYKGHYAREAIELAEQDARDRAFQAYCNSCIDDCGGCVHQSRGNKPWIGCSVAENFLKHYDNIK